MNNLRAQTPRGTFLPAVAAPEIAAAAGEPSARPAPHRGEPTTRAHPWERSAVFAGEAL